MGYLLVCFTRPKKHPPNGRGYVIFDTCQPMKDYYHCYHEFQKFMNLERHVVDLNGFRVCNLSKEYTRILQVISVLSLHVSGVFRR